MIIMLFMAVFAVISLQTFAVSYSIHGLNRVVINTPIELMYSSVTYHDFDVSIFRTDFKNNLLSYYDKYLPKYSKEYNVGFYFYNKDDGSVSTSEYCESVEITVKATINLGYKYQRVMYYELKEGMI